jgi:hypothetical protein
LGQSNNASERQVGKIGPLNAGVLERVRSEVLAAQALWVEAYGEYQSGGWHTVSVYNESGREDDVVIRDCAAIPTTLMSAFPGMRALIEELDLNIMWARLARQAANSYLYEHVDYTELDTAVGRHRLHVPITTNSSCRFVVGGRAVHLSDGYIWRITPVHPHGACNLFGPDRIHLIIDCYEDERLRAMMASEERVDATASSLEELTPDLAKGYREQSRRLLRLGFNEAAERNFLRLFFDYRMEAGLAYELIAQMYEEAGAQDRAQFWREKRGVMLGCHQ